MKLLRQASIPGICIVCNADDQEITGILPGSTPHLCLRLGLREPSQQRLPLSLLLHLRCILRLKRHVLRLDLLNSLAHCALQLLQLHAQLRNLRLVSRARCIRRCQLCLSARDLCVWAVISA